MPIGSLLCQGFTFSPCRDACLYPVQGNETSGASSALKVLASEIAAGIRLLESAITLSFVLRSETHRKEVLSALDFKTENQI